MIGTIDGVLYDKLYRISWEIGIIGSKHEWVADESAYQVKKKIKRCIIITSTR